MERNELKIDVSDTAYPDLRGFLIPYRGSFYVVGDNGDLIEEPTFTKYFPRELETFERKRSSLNSLLGQITPVYPKLHDSIWQGNTLTYSDYSHNYVERLERAFFPDFETEWDVSFFRGMKMLMAAGEFFNFEPVVSFDDNEHPVVYDMGVENKTHQKSLFERRYWNFLKQGPLKQELSKPLGYELLEELKKKTT